MRLSARVCSVMATLAALASVIGPSATAAFAAPLWSLLDPEAAASIGGGAPAHTPNVIVYPEEAPCDPTPVAATAAPKARPRRPLHRVHRRPVAPTAILHKAVVKPHHRRLRPARRVAAAPKRCVILHSETLNAADLAYADALSTPAIVAPPEATPDFGLSGGGTDVGGFGCGCGGGGGEAFPNPVSGGGGGAPAPPVKTPPGPITAAPEPRTWLLMILGVGLCAAALGRARRARAATA